MAMEMFIKLIAIIWFRCFCVFCLSSLTYKTVELTAGSNLISRNQLCLPAYFSIVCDKTTQFLPLSTFLFVFFSSLEDFYAIFVLNPTSNVNSFFQCYLKSINSNRSDSIKIMNERFYQEYEKSRHPDFGDFEL